MTAELSVQNSGQLSFAALQNENALAVIQSAELERDKNLLLGVPHVITRVTYRPGIDDKDYVSVEATLGDYAALSHAVLRKWIPNVATVDDLVFDPEERIVYNDGSTGIRRQLTMILHNAGIINVGPVEDGFSYDRPYTEWESFNQVGKMNNESGDDKIEVPDIQHNGNDAPLAIFAMRGLRVSVEPKFNKDVFYLS